MSEVKEVDSTICVLCQIFPEQVKVHTTMHHKFDIQDDQLIELPIEPPLLDEST